MTPITFIKFHSVEAIGSISTICNPRMHFIEYSTNFEDASLVCSFWNCGCHPHMGTQSCVGGCGTFGNSKTFLNVQEPTLIEINSKANCNANKVVLSAHPLCRVMSLQSGFWTHTLCILHCSYPCCMQYQHCLKHHSSYLRCLNDMNCNNFTVCL